MSKKHAARSGRASSLQLALDGAPRATDVQAAAAPAAGSAASLSAEAGERERIVHALTACGGNQSRAAKLPGIPRRTLFRRIADLGLPRPRRIAPALAAALSAPATLPG